MNIKIITDTSSEFSKEEKIKYNISTFDMPIYFEDNEYVDIDIQIVWQALLDGKKITTSQPSRENIKEEFENAKNNGYAVICILISSALSGTYETAINVKNEVDYENIYIIDSLSATMGEHILVKEACKLRDLGYTANDIFKKLEELKKHIKIYACIDSLKYLALGGRIPSAVAMIGNMLNLKPIIEVNKNGEIKVVSKKIGLIKSIKEIVNLIKKDTINEEYNMISLFACDNINANKLISSIKDNKICDNINAPREIGHVIGTHIGPGGFGVVYVKK